MEDKYLIKLWAVILGSAVLTTAVLTSGIATYNISIERSFIAHGYSQTTAPGSTSVIWVKK